MNDVSIPVIVDVIYIWKIIFFFTLGVYSFSRLFFFDCKEKTLQFLNTLLICGLSLSLIAYFMKWKIVIERLG